MSLQAGNLPDNICYPSSVQDLLELFAANLETPDSGQQIYFQPTEPTNVPEGSAWLNSTNREFRVYGKLQGATAATWNLTAILDDSITSAMIQNESITSEKLAPEIRAVLSSTSDNASTTCLRLEEKIGGGSNRALFYVMADGSLRVAGWDKNGKLGTGSVKDNTSLPKRCVFDPPLDNGEKVAKVYTQLESTFVVTDAGNVYAAGSNYHGQLGLYPTLTDTQHGVLFNRILPTSFGSKKVVDLALGSGGGPLISCYARTEDGYLYVWGNNTSGQLGRNNTTALSQPNPVGTELTDNTSRVKKIVAVGGGSSPVSPWTTRVSAYALLEDGTVWACGYNADGQLGQGNTTDLKVFTKITALTGIPDVTVVDVFACGDANRATAFFVLSNGLVYSCGNNRQGQCGQNVASTTTNINTPAPVVVGGASPYNLGSDGKKVVEVIPFDGTSTVFAILEQVAPDPDNADATITTRSAMGWGYNVGGVLGLGDSTNRIAATSLGGSFISGVKKIAVGGNNANPSAVILKSDNTLYAAGNNQSGQLGFGNQTSPWQAWKRVLLDNDTPIMDVSFGANNFVETSSIPTTAVLQVLLETGRVLVTGYDASSIGQLGVDASPTLMTTLQAVRF